MSSDETNIITKVLHIMLWVCHGNDNATLRLELMRVSSELHSTL